MQGTVEERMLSVRRSLGVDQTSAGTQICGANQIEIDRRVTNASLRPQTLQSSDNEFSDAKQKLRVETLETLFGCNDMKIHHA